MAVLIPQAVPVAGAESHGSLRNSSIFDSASKSDPPQAQVLSYTFITSNSSSCFSRYTLRNSSPRDEELSVFKTSNSSSCMFRSTFSLHSRSTLRNYWPRGQECGVGGIRIQNHNDLAMSSSTVFKNMVSSGARRAAVWECRSRGTSAPAPVCLFGGLFGGNRKVKDVVPPKQQEFKYHDVPLPFPASLLSNTFLSGKELRCCYKATVDGFGAMVFHQQCDFKGPCVIVGKTSKGMRVGAFSPEGYRSTDDYYDSFDAFLFYWPSASSGEAEAAPTSPIILPKVGGSGAALFDYARGGPQFGADGLLIGPPLSPVMGGLSGPETDSDKGQGQLSDARSRLGLSYAKRPDGKDSLFGDDRKARLVEIEVFCCPAIAALY